MCRIVALVQIWINGLSFHVSLFLHPHDGLSIIIEKAEMQWGNYQNDSICLMVCRPEDCLLLMFWPALISLLICSVYAILTVWQTQFFETKSETCVSYTDVRVSNPRRQYYWKLPGSRTCKDAFLRPQSRWNSPNMFKNVIKNTNKWCWQLNGKVDEQSLENLNSE